MKKVVSSKRKKFGGANACKYMHWSPWSWVTWSHWISSPLDHNKTNMDFKKGKFGLHSLGLKQKEINEWRILSICISRPVILILGKRFLAQLWEKKIWKKKLFVKNKTNKQKNVIPILLLLLYHLYLRKSISSFSSADVQTNDAGDLRSKIK